MNCRSVNCDNNNNKICKIVPHIGEKGVCESYSPPENERPAKWFLTDAQLCQCCQALDDHTYVCVQICKLENEKYTIAATKVNFSETFDDKATVQPDFVRPVDCVFKGKVFLELMSVITSMRKRDYWIRFIQDDRFDSFDEAKGYLQKVVDCALPNEDELLYIQLL